MKIRSLNLGAARTTAHAARTPDGAAMEVRYPGMAAIELTKTVPVLPVTRTQRCAGWLGERREAFRACAPVWLSRSAQQRKRYDEQEHDEAGELEQTPPETDGMNADG